MIAYFDTSALVPLIVAEAGSEAAALAWDNAGRIAGVSVIYAEARAALGQARRSKRASPSQVKRAIAELDRRYGQMDLVEIDDALVRDAGRLADDFALRGYDAVHLAAALRVTADDLVVVAGDRPLLAAAEAAGLSTVRTG